MALESLKIAKIITKTECCKHPKSYCLEVKHLIHFDYHYLLVAETLINFPQCIQVTAIAACFVCLVSYFFHFSRLKMGCQNAIKTQKIYLWTTCKSFKNLLFNQFPILVILRKCDKKFEKWAYIKLDKSETSQNWIFLFTMIIFVWIFFKDANSVIFSVDFLA